MVPMVPQVIERSGRYGIAVSRAGCGHHQSRSTPCYTGSMYHDGTSTMVPAGRRRPAARRHQSQQARQHVGPRRRRDVPRGIENTCVRKTTTYQVVHMCTIGTMVRMVWHCNVLYHLVHMYGIPWYVYIRTDVHVHARVRTYRYGCTVRTCVRTMALWVLHNTTNGSELPWYSTW
jgi:hypothetical protein